MPIRFFLKPLQQFACWDWEQEVVGGGVLLVGAGEAAARRPRVRVVMRVENCILVVGRWIGLVWEIGLVEGGLGRF